MGLAATRAVQHLLLVSLTPAVGAASAPPSHPALLHPPTHPCRSQLWGQPRHQLHVPLHREHLPLARHGGRTRLGCVRGCWCCLPCRSAGALRAPRTAHLASILLALLTSPYFSRPAPQTTFTPPTARRTSPTWPPAPSTASSSRRWRCQVSSWTAWQLLQLHANSSCGSGAAFWCLIVRFRQVPSHPAYAQCSAPAA